jgi:hypothetical protein
LVTKSETPSSLRLDPLLLGFLAGNQDERQLLQAAQLRCTHTLQQFVTVQLGHLQIRDDRPDRVIDNQRLPGRFAVPLLAHLVTPFEVLYQRHAHNP